MFDDMTRVNVPFGLLDRDTQEALKAHGGPWEVYFYPGQWEPMPLPNWDNNLVYRVKPAPPKPREWWLTECGGYLHTHDNLAAAQTYSACNRNVRITHVREVLPE